MATQRQFEFFKSLYDEEGQRTDKLYEHAKNNLALATFYSAFVLFILDKDHLPATPMLKALFLASLASMLLAFLLSLWATQVSDFEVASLPGEILLGFGASPPTNSAFFKARIPEYAAACEKNSNINDKKAIFLSIARYFLLTGITLHASYFAARVL